jgi:hypothetical protein
MTHKIIYSGTEFKELYKFNTFYIILKDEFTHKNGLNIDSNLYFITINNLINYFEYYDTCNFKYICQVKILDDSEIYVDDIKFNTNKCILDFSTLIEISDLSLWYNYNFCITTINQYPKALKYIKNQTEELCLTAVEINGLTLEFVKNQTEEICLAAVSQNGEALKYVLIQTEEICLAAVRHYPFNQTELIQLGNWTRINSGFCYVENQTPKICLEAVKYDGLTLQHVKEQTPEICSVAIQQNCDALEYIKEQTPEIFLRVE